MLRVAGHTVYVEFTELAGPLELQQVSYTVLEVTSTVGVIHCSVKYGAVGLLGHI